MQAATRTSDGRTTFATHALRSYDHSGRSVAAVICPMPGKLRNTAASGCPASSSRIRLGRQFLAAVGRQGPRGKRLKAFFGCLYYAGLRPEEAIDLRPENLISLPEHGWGEMRLTHSQPRSGAKWTDSGRSRERRELKHRAAGDSRLVPVHPELVTLIREHMDEFGSQPGRRIFTRPRGGVVAEWAYLEVFHEARQEALGDADADTP